MIVTTNEGGDGKRTVTVYRAGKEAARANEDRQGPGQRGRVRHELLLQLGNLSRDEATILDSAMVAFEE